MAYPLLRVLSQDCCTMIDALFAQPNYVAAKKCLDASALRHQAIAQNLANLETPNYQRIDIQPNFADQLRQALGAQDSKSISYLHPFLAPDRSALAHRPDGNTVQLESELMQLNQNSVEHSLQTQLITGSLLRLRLAITGRPH